MSTEPPGAKASPSNSSSRDRPPRIQNLVDAKRLREQAASAASVAAVWRKAVESARDAELPGMSIDGSLRAAYDAGHMAALALLAGHGLRPSGGQGHHEIAFAAVAAFGDTAFENLVSDSEEVRTLRKGSMYDAAIAGAEERRLAIEWMRQMLPELRAALVRADRELDMLLVAYP